MPAKSVYEGERGRCTGGQEDDGAGGRWWHLESERVGEGREDWKIGNGKGAESNLKDFKFCFAELHRVQVIDLS